MESMSDPSLGGWSRESLLNGSELLQAVYDSPADVVENLLAKGADPNEGDAWGYTPLMSAVTRGDPRVVRLLLRAGADARRRDVDGWTVLMAAAVSKNHPSEALVQLLLDHGADPCASAVFGGQKVTALGLAKRSNGQLVEILASASAAC